MKNLPAPQRSTQSPSSLASETAQSFAASGRYVDAQVALDARESTHAEAFNRAVRFRDEHAKTTERRPDAKVIITPSTEGNADQNNPTATANTPPFSALFLLFSVLAGGVVGWILFGTLAAICFVAVVSAAGLVSSVAEPY